MLDLAVRLFDPAALALVAGGSLLVAALRSTRGDLGRAARSVRALFKADPAGEETLARRAVRQVERIVELRGIACADRADATSPFVRKAALRLADTPSAEAFAAWAASDLEARTARHQSVIAVWRAAADAAPSMGMVGTVLGLIAMFASMSDPAAIGPAMALALLTTLYGLALGTLLFGSAAARLERLSEAELRWQSAILVRLEVLAHAEVHTANSWLAQRRAAA